MAESAMKFVPQASSKSEYVTSAATVKVLPDNKVQICYLDKYNTKENPPVLTREVNFSDGQKCKIFDFSELPVQFSADDEGAEVIFRVKSEGSKIVEFLPENENEVDAKFIDFYRPNGEGTNPLPVEKPKWNKNDPKEASILQAAAKFKIEGGLFDGKFVFGYFQLSKKGISKKGNPYEFITFVKDDAGNLAFGFDVLPNGTTGQQWSDFVYSLRHCGLTAGSPIPYPEDGNPLLAIEQKLQMANKTVKLAISKGYVVDIDSPKKLTVSLAKKEEVAQPVVPANPDEM